jgi:hypothetical protein
MVRETTLLLVITAPGYGMHSMMSNECTFATAGSGLALTVFFFLHLHRNQIRI